MSDPQPPFVPSIANAKAELTDGMLNQLIDISGRAQAGECSEDAAAMLIWFAHGALLELRHRRETMQHLHEITDPQKVVEFHKAR